MPIEESRPTLSPDEALTILADAYGLTGQLSPLPSERDQNFAFESANGMKAILKISQHGEDPEALAFQEAMLAHLAVADPGLPVPRLIARRDCALSGTVDSADGRSHAVRLVSYLPGEAMADARGDHATLRDLGHVLGRLDRALLSFGHAGAMRTFDWDIRQTPRARARLAAIRDAGDRARVADILDAYDSRVAPALARLPHQVIHNDANDWNLLVDAAGRVSGVIDFGDALFSPRVADVAVALAYAMMERDNPILAGAELVAGYHAEHPLSDLEFALLPDLIAARLAISVSLSSERAALAADNPYLSVSERGAFRLIETLARQDRHIVTGIFRKAAGLEAAPGAERVKAWLAAHRNRLAPLMQPHPARAEKHVLKLADLNDPLVAASRTQDHARAAALYAAEMQAAGAELGMGPWGEVREVYAAPFFASKLIAGERRKMHLGLDLFAPAGTVLTAPLQGRVVGLAINPDPLDYGGLIVLEHEPEPGLVFRTLWGHLAHASIERLSLGQMIAAGAEVARLGDTDQNGGWLPHLHLQVVLPDYPDIAGIPGVGEAALEAVWADLYPKAYDLAGLPPETFEKTGRDKASLLAARKALLGPNLSLSYREPLKIVRGEGVWLIDAGGRAYLDCYNNVAHVGHCHPHVVAALRDQIGTLNTNTRYLHDAIIDYAERLKATLPEGLDTFYFTSSGSEANEVALRMARAVTGRKGTLVIDWAYHGTTQGLIDVSAYKYKRKGGQGKPATTHELPLPEVYRAPADWPSDEIGARYVAEAEEIIAGLVARGEVPAAFIAETIPSVAGQVFLPEGYLKGVYAAAGKAGIVCIADEVQVGFGRVGGAMWAFEEHGVVPDIVTMGKPIGAGHPMGLVATRRDIAAAFANGMEYFNTFGGNPVSCRAAAAVLDVMEAEGLKENAAREGAYLLEAFRAMMAEDEQIGDVRGRGLFLGIEIVRDRASKAHNGARAGAIVGRMRELGVLAGTDGPFDNVIKLRPPMVFAREHSDLLLTVFRQALAETRGR